MSKMQTHESSRSRKTLTVNSVAEKPKVYYLENTLTPEQNKALFRRGVRALLEIIEEHGGN